MKIVMEHVGKEMDGQKILDDVTFTIQEPGIYAVLGPNGAGKTTIMHILSGLSTCTSGNVMIDGENPFENRVILDKISFIQESENFKPTLKVSQIIHYVQAFYPNWNHELVTKLITLFKLPMNKRLNQLSKGMVSALNMSIGLASRAPLTIFDEPYIGMDATARKKLYAEIIEDYVDHPRVILFSTHFIEETQNIFEHALIVQNGTIKLFTSIDELTSRAMKISGPIDVIQSLGIPEQKILSYQEFMSEASVTTFLENGEDLHVPPTCQAIPLPLQEFFIDFTSEKESVVS
ncbi:ATP-binding cassette domain-containing protein [Shouchella patagoniensis]|uniref:ATP-binding cassette domain-containing protein n=1 Tax=Shouchella patagoniensis TaxID=228576 RepID=UPI000995D0DA|nr:ABC transporter ATP-binding protein [Shouchella patagoniensis]